MSLSITLDGQPITAQASDLRIKSVSPGGFASVQFNLDRKLDTGLLEQFTDCQVFDSSTGEQVAGGRLMDQGRNDDGTWQVVCLGEGLASMQDQKAPYFLIDQALDQWNRSLRSTKRLDASPGVYPGQSDDETTLFFDGASEGATIDIGDSVIMDNRIGVLCGQNIGGIGFITKSGSAASANWRSMLYSGATVVTGGTVVRDAAWSTTPSARIVEVVGGNIPAGQMALGLRWRRVNTTTTINDGTWSMVRDIIIRAQIYDQTGALRTSGYTNEYVYIHEAFIDLVARFCPRLDLANALIDVGTYHFDQLAWVDGITPMDAIEDLIKLEPAFTWHVWEQTADQKWATELISLPAEVRYDASVADGFSAPSPTTEVFNKVYVRWTSPGGRTQVTPVTSVVPSLDDAGVTRAETIDLGDEVGSTAQATQRGTAWLAEHGDPPNAGTLTIARSIEDHDTGRWVKPWNIRPGGLIRVRGIQPTPDTLNATSPDGVTIFRIVSVQYVESAGAAILELDTHTLTESRAIADLARKRIRKR